MNLLDIITKDKSEVSPEESAFLQENQTRLTFAEKKYYLSDIPAKKDPPTPPENKLKEIQAFVNLFSFSENGNDLPKIIKVLPTGVFKTRYGTQTITRQDIDEMVQHFNENIRAASATTGLPIDFEHGQTSMKDAAGAWMKNLFAQDDGLYANMDYTDLGKQALSGGVYKFFSPTFYLKGYVGPEDGKEYDNVIEGGAFCNKPVLTHSLPPLMHSETVKTALLTDEKNLDTLILEIENSPKKQTQTMTLSEIVAKAKDQRSSEEQKFLVDNKEQLTLAQAKAEGLLEFTEKPKAGQITLSETQFAELQADAKAGKEASQQLKKTNLINEVKQLVFTEKGSKIPTDQIEVAADMLMNMSEDMATKYKAQLKALPEPVQFAEIGSDNGINLSDDPQRKWTELATARSTEKKITFSQAEDELRKEHPDLFASAYAVKSA